MVYEEDDFLREKISGVLSRRSDVQTVTQLSRMDPNIECAWAIKPDIIIVDIRMALRHEKELNNIKQAMPGVYVIGVAEHVESIEACIKKLPCCNILTTMNEIVYKVDEVLKKNAADENQTFDAGTEEGIYRHAG